MITMTYGNLPEKDQFYSQFAKTVDGKFTFTNDPRVGTESFSVEELWDEVVLAHKEAESAKEIRLAEEIEDWLSSVLWCLGFEWI